MEAKEKSEIQEQLVKLYLRLNGYLTSGFIVHSNQCGKTKGEVDVLAVRFPNNCEPERVISHHKKLFTSNSYIDLLICEVKSHGQKPRFNEFLRDNIKNLHFILRWFGALTPKEVEEYSEKIHNFFQNGNIGEIEPSKFILEKRNIRIRPLIFKPETRSRRDEQPWFITQQDIFDYINTCMKPEITRATCTTTYDHNAWGFEYEPIISFFKNGNYNKDTNIDALYAHIALQK